MNPSASALQYLNNESEEGVRTVTARLQQAICRLGAMALVVGSTTMFAAYGQQMPAEYDGAMKTLGKQGDFKEDGSR